MFYVMIEIDISLKKELVSNHCNAEFWDRHTFYPIPKIHPRIIFVFKNITRLRKAHSSQI